MALITLSNAQLAYGHVALLDHTDFSLEEGERVGIIGRNGAGKSSMLKILAGIETPDDGTLTIQQGVRIAYVPQEPVFAEGATTFEAACAGVANVIALIDEFSTGEGDLEKIQSQIESQDGWNWQQRVEETLERLQLGKDELVSSLSGGTKKRLALAQALVQRPEVLFLDEPTTGLDPQARHILWDRLFRLKEKGVTLLITTHHMDEAEQLCDRLMVMDKGEIMAEGSPAELIKKYSTKEVLEVRFGSDRNSQMVEKLQSFAERLEELPDRLLLYTESGEDLLAKIVAANIHPNTSLVRRSSLEDVFLRLTGRSLIE